MITMLNIKDVVAIVEANLDSTEPREANAKRRILAALDELANPKRPHVAPFDVDPKPRLAALEARLSRGEAGR